jgi:hypothetical protein
MKGMDMKYKKTYMVIALITLLVLVFASSSMLLAALNGNFTEGVVVNEKTTIKYNPSSSVKSVATGTSGPSQSYLHEIIVNYQINGQTYTIRQNVHVLKYLNVFQTGQTVTVFFDQNNPQDAGVLDYGIYSPMTLIGGYVLIVLILGVAFQLVRSKFVR